MNPESSATQPAAGLPVRVKIFGVGGAGVAMLSAIDFPGSDLAAVDTDVCVAQVVRQDDEDVGPARGLRSGGRGGRQRESDQEGNGKKERAHGGWVLAATGTRAGSPRRTNDVAFLFSHLQASGGL